MGTQGKSGSKPKRVKVRRKGPSAVFKSGDNDEAYLLDEAIEFAHEAEDGGDGLLIFLVQRTGLGAYSAVVADAADMRPISAKGPYASKEKAHAEALAFQKHLYGLYLDKKGPENVRLIPNPLVEKYGIDHDIVVGGSVFKTHNVWFTAAKDADGFGFGVSTDKVDGGWVVNVSLEGKVAAVSDVFEAQEAADQARRFIESGLQEGKEPPQRLREALDALAAQVN